VKAHVFHRLADEEFLSALQYYQAIDPQLAQRFYEKIEEMIQEVCGEPRRFRIIRAPVRRHLAKVFPYALLFVDHPDDILIVAVMHCGRQPEYWATRL
jgi:plasmid stabilization system protein ParE